MLKNWFKENKLAIIIIGVLFLGLVAGWIVYVLFGRTLIIAMYEGKVTRFFRIPLGLGSKDQTITNYLIMARQALTLFSFLLGVSMLLCFFKKILIGLLAKLLRAKDFDEAGKRMFSLFILLGCSLTCLFALAAMGFKGPWYSLKKVMLFSEDGLFQRRILFVLLANLVKMIFPAISYFSSYLISQLISLVLVFYIIKKWAKLFITKELAYVAQLLLVIILIPTFTYYNFYDIGIIFFYTISLLFLFKKQLIKYLFAFTIGTFNHEITLFLIFIYAVIYFDSNIKRGEFWGYLLLQLVLYIGVRSILFIYLPGSWLWQGGRVWYNINLILYDPVRLLMTMLMFVFWYVAVFLGIKDAPKELKRCLILFPLLLVEVFLVGKFSEVRQFNAFIPIVIGFILCFISQVSSKTNLSKA